ncbi:helix-turn-helix transcriptional regulator [Streptacidiphilus sp. EB129]|uniref:helix-turn-helix transcriptional regulator n=1 Tax=Streptacidiphilus sp. EB129 TaxID=3156262 RepID=UPI0035167D4D
MLDTSARLLRLLSLLQTHRDWTGPELAERLDITTRTVRRDMERLRELGYPVHATPGVAGGYRLGAGAALPPLLLDDDEAVAVAIGLRTSVGGGVAGIEETSLRALAKLEQVLPSRLRHRVSALQSATLTVAHQGPTVEPDVLAAIAGACRDRMRMRFEYLSHGGEPSRRQVEPLRLVWVGRRWYLLGWDVQRDDWRTFRADRITAPQPTGPRFPVREFPGDPAEHVLRGITQSPYRFSAKVILHAPAEEIADRIPVGSGALLEPLDDSRCIMHTAGDSLDGIAIWIAVLGYEFEIVEPVQLAEHAHRVAARLHAAATPLAPPPADL